MEAKSKYLMELGSRIKKRRLELNLSQDELSKLCGYTSRASINKIELGHIDLPLSKVRILSDILGVSLLYIICGDVSDTTQLSEDEELLLKKYRCADSVTHEMVHRILGIKEKNNKKAI